MSFWSIFQSLNIRNIFSNATNSNVNLKKDDDYLNRRHLAIMKEIDKYKSYDIKSLSDSDIEIIAATIYSLVKESGEIYPESEMLYEELREIKKVLLLEDSRIRRELKDLIHNTEGLCSNYKLNGLRECDQFIIIASLEAQCGRNSILRNPLKDIYF